QELGEQIFRTHFGPEETGTSILIIDPVISFAVTEDEAAERSTVMTDEHAQLLTADIENALARNAWPKIVPVAPNQSPMRFKLFLNLVDQQVEESIRKKYEAYAYSLGVVRS